MSPDPRDMEPGARVEFDWQGMTWHGNLVSAGPKWAFVWKSPTQSCLRIPVQDVERADTRGDHPGDTYDGPTTLHTE